MSREELAKNAAGDTTGGPRHRGRSYALQVLFALDMNEGAEHETALSEYAGAFAITMDDRSMEFARELVQTTQTHRDELDAVIQSASRNWRLERMSRVDRNILRLATCELNQFPDVPVRVVINEAVELAKRFGASESAAFVNGILDRIAQELKRR